MKDKKIRDAIQSLDSESLGLAINRLVIRVAAAGGVEAVEPRRLNRLRKSFREDIRNLLLQQHGLQATPEQMKPFIDAFFRGDLKDEGFP